MGFLNLEQEDKKIEINAISKSMIYTYEQCPTQVYKSKKQGIPLFNENNRDLKVLMLARDLFYQKIAEKKGESFYPREETDPSIILEAEEIIEKTDIDRIIKSDTIVDYNVSLSTLLPNDINLSAKADLILLVEDEYETSYLRVVSFKITPFIQKEVDNNMLLTAFLVAQNYGLDVVVQNISGVNMSSFGEYFSYKKAIKLENSFSKYTSKIKSELETDEEPMVKIGTHCKECPFLNECEKKAIEGYGENGIENKFIELFVLKQKVSAIEKELKELTKKSNNLEAGKYKATFSSSISYTIKNKGLTKAKLIELLKEIGILNKYSSDLDIKLKEHHVQDLEKYGVILAPQVKRSFKISVQEDNEDNKNSENKD